MKLFLTVWIMIAAMIVTAVDCNSQQPGDRKPAVAGQFYPGSKSELTDMLKEMYAKAVPSKQLKGVAAVIVPHAGYVFSGGVAASSFNQIDPDAEYENIFILGPSHRVGFEGAAVYTKGNFITPLGTVAVNTALGAELVQQSKVFLDRSDAHQQEHSLEVQLPFLQHRMKKPFRIVPLSIGANRMETIKKIAGVLRPYFNAKNLFVISTDFSHYPAYKDANVVDKASGDAILTNNVESLVAAIAKNENKNIQNLQTCMCGISCVLTLLYMTAGDPAVNMTELEYKNSGDSPYGDRDQVVGYYAIAVTRSEQVATKQFALNDNEKRELLGIARQTLESFIRTQKKPKIEVSTVSEILRTPCGAFVTLHKRGDLRGCIGRFDATDPLYEVVQEMAIASSTQDYRFSPVEAGELNVIDIEISVLTPMQKVTSADDVVLGKHGIYIKKGNRAGTFLPQVAAETGWTKEEFLGHCSQDKAGLGWDGWKTAELFVYEAIVFGELELKK